MALSDYQSADTIARSKRGTTSRNLGGKTVVATQDATPRPSNIERFSQKVGDVAGQVGSLGTAGVKKGAGFVANTAKDVFKEVGTAVTLLGYVGSEPIKQYKLQNRQDEWFRDQRRASELWRSGAIDTDEYKRRLKDLKRRQEEISKFRQSRVNDAFGIGVTTRTKDEQGNYTGGYTNQVDALDPAWGLINILTLGAGTTAKELAKQGGKQYVKSAGIRGSLEAAENAITRIPGVRQAVERNTQYLIKREAQQLAGETTAQFVGREAKNIAAGLLIKRPLFYQSNIGGAQEIYRNILEDDNATAAWTAALIGSQMLEGGPLGLFFKGIKAGKGKLGALARGNESFIDTLSKQIGDGNSQQVARFLVKSLNKAPNSGKRAEEVFRIAQELNTRVTRGNVGQAVENFLRPYTDAGVDLTTITPSQLFKDMDNWYKADQVWADAVKAGAIKMTAEEAARFTPVRWDATIRDAVANAVRNAGDSFEEQFAAVQDIANRPGVGFGNNNTLMQRIQAIFNQGGTKEDIARAIQGIDAAVTTPARIPKGVAKQLAKLGYTIAEPVGGRVIPHLELDDTKKLVSSAVRGGDLFDEAVAPNAAVRGIARTLEAAGLSPQESSVAATRALSQSVAANLDRTLAGSELGLFKAGGNSTNGGQAILNKLQNYVENKPGVRGFSRISSGKSAITDIRQLRISEIQEALGSYTGDRLVKMSRAEAKEIYRAITKGYQEVPLELRGLGDKIVDGLFRVNPLQKHYSRIQSALRYTYSPFFRTQERVETAILARAQASNLIWNRSRNELNDAVRILDENQIFSGVLPGEAAQDMVLGRITANLTKGQKRDLAGLAMDIADSQGRTLDDLAKTSPEILDDALRVVVQYPKRGILASPLARTLNLVFFPIRYNTKVTMMAAQVLAKQPPSVQKAVLHSAFKAREWLKSDEGIRWQSEHADAIQILKWVSPVNSIESTFKLLTGPDSWGEMGMLGGLPLGFITQILDGQGIINLNKPYVDPKTGDVFPDYIPQTTKARAATALGDMINTLFTYPGRVLGLPGKEQTVRTLIKQIIETEGKDFEKRLDMNELTPLQKNWVRVVQGDTSEEALDALYTSPQEGQFNWYTLPPLTLPVRPTVEPFEPVERRTGLPSKSKGGKKPKKRALAMPVR